MVTHRTAALQGQHILSCLAGESPVCFNQQMRKVRKLTNKEDPMSHRIIEKRRRDRMNNCLADLSRLIPADCLKKGRGRIEKTEIIEMAIKHMKHLQTRASKPADCEDSDRAPTSREEVPPVAPIDTEHYRLGYQECLSEAMHFMVEVEGFYAGDPICVQLIGHLQKHCDKILKGDRLNWPRAHVNETTSNSSGSSGGSSYPPHHRHPPSSCSDAPELGAEEGSQLRDMLTSPNLVCHNRSEPEPEATGSLYKFKNNIRQRFDRDGSKRRRFESGPPARRHSDTCSTPSPPPSPLPSAPVPIFALHARGAYYVPLTIHADVLAPYFRDLHLEEDEAATSLVLHPVTISVDFKQRTSRAMSLLSGGFVPLPNWFNPTDRHSMPIPPYSKHV